jgi:uncharacterized protein with beta-barrel porin domain
MFAGKRFPAAETYWNPVLHADKSFAMQVAILTVRGRAAWAHDLNPDRAIGATFQTLAGASFFVNGAAQASDSALVTASPR